MAICCELTNSAVPVQRITTICWSTVTWTWLEEILPTEEGAWTSWKREIQRSAALGAEAAAGIVLGAQAGPAGWGFQQSRPLEGIWQGKNHSWGKIKLGIARSLCSPTLSNSYLFITGEGSVVELPAEEHSPAKQRVAAVLRTRQLLMQQNNSWPTFF